MGNLIRRFDSNDNPLPIGTPAVPAAADSACAPTTPTPSTDQSPLPPMPRTPILSPRRANEHNFLPTPTPPTTTTTNPRRTPEILGHLLRDTFILTPLAPTSAPLQDPRRGVVLLRQDQETSAALQNRIMGSEDRDGGVALVPCESNEYFAVENLRERIKKPLVKTQALHYTPLKFTRLSLPAPKIKAIAITVHLIRERMYHAPHCMNQPGIEPGSGAYHPKMASARDTTTPLNPDYLMYDHIFGVLGNGG
ncbi:uncharacterized protein H6S33_007956 [Morchella sextelata]|uniref:uncharacterized protein n=1 Tax=Morchella sextelata TaxID=1174677 RepID=UPI001D05A6A5|nr:uncharacterized protein H6S33_007956 [Morchella sextelata]KAH0602952.1 hypothetical protein H6S33_007956 [Morchella sextelata]